MNRISFATLNSMFGRFVWSIYAVWSANNPWVSALPWQNKQDNTVTRSFKPKDVWCRRNKCLPILMVRCQDGVLHYLKSTRHHQIRCQLSGDSERYKFRYPRFEARTLHPLLADRLISLPAHHRRLLQVGSPSKTVVIVYRGTKHTKP
jgi:hypothetical protein